MFDKTAFSDAGAQSLGTSPNRFPQVRTPWDLSEDVTVLKRFKLTESAMLQLRLELIDVLNRHYFGGVDLDMNSSSFGNIRTASGNRTGQLGARIEW